MDNPLEQPAPLDPLERVQAFARDLAWGVLNRDWSARLSVVAYAAGGSEFWQHNPKGHDSFVQYIETKWQNEVPDLELLRALGYMHLEPVKEDSNSRVFILSQSAFQLLEKPLAPPSVFISYQRATSSAFQRGKLHYHEPAARSVRIDGRDDGVSRLSEDRHRSRDRTDVS